MKISTSPPPNYEKVKAVFPSIKFERGTVFTYGDTVHVASGYMPPDLVVHEGVHVVQQNIFPEQWWDRYLTDQAFRLDQELAAYRAQYAWVKRNIKGKQQQFNYLKGYAQDLSGQMYGNMVDIYQALHLLAH